MLVKVRLKWLKTMQNRDTVLLLKSRNCSFKALSRLYPMSIVDFVFPVQTILGWHPLTDTKVKKTLKAINMTLGLDLYFFQKVGCHFCIQCICANSAYLSPLHMVL